MVTVWKLCVIYGQGQGCKSVPGSILDLKKCVCLSSALKGQFVPFDPYVECLEQGFYLPFLPLLPFTLN